MAHAESIQMDVQRATDLSNPHKWFPLARERPRKVILHIGPTNSGKTHTALQRLKQAQTGVYCGPLRLLAAEVYSTLNSEGVACNLVTGQQIKEEPHSNHVACTVEMAEVGRRVDVAVVDEIQMIADPYRGWAWTRAVLGLAADEVHLCGNESAIDLLCSLTRLCGDHVEIKRYNRLSPLNTKPKALRHKYHHLRKGDAIIAFSRRKIFDIQQAVQSITGMRCAVVYGGLPPETRLQQAHAFNSPHSGVDVLVATDAVGMGLNLNIRRVVFSTLRKFDGTQERQLSTSEIKQIAGRAGRYNSAFPNGEVACWLRRDVWPLQQALESPLPSENKAGLLFNYEQLNEFRYALSDQFDPSMGYADLLYDFANAADVGRGHYFMCDWEEMLSVALRLDAVDGLSMRERHVFCMAPIDAKKEECVAHLVHYARAHADPSNTYVPCVVNLDLPQSPRERLEALETAHHILDCYLWLSHRFDTFDSERAEKRQQQISKHIKRTLDRLEGRSFARHQLKKKMGGRNEKKTAYHTRKSLHPRGRKHFH